MRRIAHIILVISLMALVHAEDIRIACVGNSITSGQSNPKTDLDTYPAQLGVLMGEGYDVQNFGVSGRTMLKKGDYPLWVEPAFTEALEFKPHIVTIMLGTNDSKPYNWVYKDEFIPDYYAMIDTFRSLDSNPEIYLCLPPPAFSVQWDIRDSVITADIIPMIRQIAQDKNTQIIDFYTPFIDKNELFPDDIHPSKDGCWEIAKIFYSHLTNKNVQQIQDVNLALRRPVHTALSSLLPVNLVDGDIKTICPCPDGESVVIDLGSTESIDMLQIIFAESGSYAYKIETSGDGTSWDMAVDKYDRQDTIRVAIESINPTETQYVRFTFNSADEMASFVSLAELKILKSAPVHAPLLTYNVTRVTSRNIRLDLIITSSIKGGYLKYFSKYGPDEPFITSRGYRYEDEDIINISVTQDNEKYYYASFCKDGYEVASDTVRLDYSLSGVEEKPSGTPHQFNLYQNYPNPFNPSTEIHYELSAPTRVRLAVYDCLGREVETLVDQFQKAGDYFVQFHSRHLSSGIYFCRLEALSLKKTMKMVLLN
jgi:lysophospholipase L1-like esterase